MVFKKKIYVEKKTKQYALLLAFMYSTSTCTVNPHFYLFISVRNSITVPRKFLSAPAPDSFIRYREHNFF
jgi:hypothetical protein